ncbi:MAG TPA: hypothetical protein VFQ48_10540 [Pseudonocardiaceae bacterium]|nr:hypothetical protein [Pseudonocardiaceae bacterium]
MSREHVELVTEEIREVQQRSVITADGAELQVDVLVLGTGFRAAEMPTARLIRGRGGRLLADEWPDSQPVPAHRSPQCAGAPPRGCEGARSRSS